MFARRLALVALVIGVTVAVDAGTASAHLCAHAALVPVGQPHSVSVAVTVEATPVRDVEIDIPSDLHINRVDPQTGWKITRSGSTLRYRGGPIEPFSCEYFTMSLTAPAKGSWAIPVVQRTADGTIVARSFAPPGQPLNPTFVQTVWAGEKPPAPKTGDGLPGGISAVGWIGIAFVSIAVLFGAVMALRRRRTRHDEFADLDDEAFDAAMRELELQERLDRFKKQTRRRPVRD